VKPLGYVIHGKQGDGHLASPMVGADALGGVLTHTGSGSSKSQVRSSSVNSAARILAHKRRRVDHQTTPTRCFQENGQIDAVGVSFFGLLERDRRDFVLDDLLPGQRWMSR
jgi:hypothetical protein